MLQDVTYRLLIDIGIDSTEFAEILELGDVETPVTMIDSYISKNDELVKQLSQMEVQMLKVAEALMGRTGEERLPNPYPPCFPRLLGTDVVASSSVEGQES